VLASALATILHVWRRYAVVQVNSMPDALVFAALGPRLMGARVLLDLHECMPEFYASKFRTDPSHPAVRLLAWLEQASIRFADRCLTCTDQMRDMFVRRGARGDKIDVILNGADEDVFDPRRFPPRAADPNTFVLISHGSVEERYGLDTVIRAVALLRDEMPGLGLEIYGEGSCLDALRRLAAELGVERQVRFSGRFVPLPELVRAIANADAGVVAIKRDAFRDLTLCNKMYDFISMRKPVIASRTGALEAYFDNSSLQLFTSGDVGDLARAIRGLYVDAARREKLVQQAALAGESHRWRHQRQRYNQSVGALVFGRPRPLISRTVSSRVE
jgi:glycosyltransferase involved in cell wall biosynthesis